MFTNINIKNKWFLSPDKTLSVLHPRIPENRAIYEEDNIPRICVSNSIEGCLKATEHHHDKKILYIYTISNKLSNRVKGVSNLNLVKYKLVDDAHITKEYWICENIKLELIGYVELDNTVKTTIKFFTFNCKRLNKEEIHIPNYKIYYF